MKTYIITIEDARRGKLFIENIGFFGFPEETPKKENARRYLIEETAKRYAANLNSNLRFCYQQNGTPAENQTFYNVETIGKALNSYWISGKETLFVAADIKTVRAAFPGVSVLWLGTITKKELTAGVCAVCGRQIAPGVFEDVRTK